MARCSHAANDSAKEIKYYRAFTYRGDLSDAQFLATDTAKLMYYAQILDKAGQTVEAATIYNHAAMLLKYMDGKPSDGYMLPLFGNGPLDIAYTSAHLQALTQVALGIHTLYTQELKPAERLAHLHQAALLYPDSPIVYAYLGRELDIMQNTADADAAWDKANALGLPQVNALLDAQEAAMQAQKTQTQKVASVGK